MLQYDSNVILPYHTIHNLYFIPITKIYTGFYKRWRSSRPTCASFGLIMNPGFHTLQACRYDYYIHYIYVKYEYTYKYYMCAQFI